MSMQHHEDGMRSLIGLDPDDDDYTCFGRETAAVTLNRDDVAMAETLSRAWRSGAPEEVLTMAIATYASAHDMDPDEVVAIDNAAHAVTVHGNDGGLHPRLTQAVHFAAVEGVGDALVSAQNDEEPCFCGDCIAEVAARN
jgi:hypothetical protein